MVNCTLNLTRYLVPGTIYNSLCSRLFEDGAPIRISGLPRLRTRRRWRAHTRYSTAAVHVQDCDSANTMFTMGIEIQQVDSLDAYRNTMQHTGPALSLLGHGSLNSQALTWVDNDRAEGAVPHGFLAQNIRLSPRHHRCVPLVWPNLLRLQRLSPESHKPVHGALYFLQQWQARPSAASPCLLTAATSSVN